MRCDKSSVKWEQNVIDFLLRMDLIVKDVNALACLMDLSSLLTLLTEGTH